MRLLSLNEVNTANRNVQVVQKSKVESHCLSGNKNQCLEAGTGEKNPFELGVGRQIDMSQNEIKGILAGRKRSAGRRENPND